MIYKDFKGKKLSALGMGCMRFPVIPDSDGVVDEEMTGKMVDYAIANGINYFDTAWMYHNGNSEKIIGKLLKKHPRDSYYLATKFPGFSPENMGKVKEIFEEQLRKCDVEYFDFYLFHNVAEKNIDGFTDEKFSIFRYLMEQKKAGRIKHLGFSTHGSLATIKRFLDTYGKDLEFCQIQLNYLDWTLENAKAKVELLNSYGIPIWVMEPVRGGNLVNLEEADVQKLNALRPGVATPEWAFRFLQSVEGVTMVLSGMSDPEQLAQNIETFSEHKPVNEQEWNTLMEIADGIISKKAIPCTACRYCTERCPQSLPIPELIKQFNDGEKPEDAQPSDCIGCRNCEIVCPQGIMISEVMAAFAEKLKLEV